MKGVVLAGGTGSRLFPLTKVTNKHLLPVGKKPMILHPIEKLVESGVDEIVVVTGVEHMGAVVNLLGSGKDYGCRFSYKVQDEAGGIAQALGLVQSFCQNDKMIVILGDNIFEGSLKEHVKDFEQQSVGAKVLLQENANPHRFGVAEVNGNQIVNITEKPSEPKSNLVVTGIYFFDAQVFDIIGGVQPSGRGELEITDVNNRYIEKGQMQFSVLQGRWTDAGTFESLHTANTIMNESLETK